jgi:hypothetical protein
LVVGLFAQPRRIAEAGVLDRGSVENLDDVQVGQHDICEPFD